ncbi:MAG TPA: type II toxin-antitoxin system HicA family toxin [Armatimonadota bacterium]|nr:type II toxin-antitoxin system HicA family toxin [Armatimonadota bacterium]
MRLPRDLDPQRLVSALSILGYRQSRQSGSHIRITTQINGEHHEVAPSHNPIKIGTLQSILSSIARHHDMSVQELLQLLRL